MKISLELDVCLEKFTRNFKLDQHGALQVVFGGVLGGMLSLSTVEKPGESQSETNAQKHCCQTRI